LETLFYSDSPHDIVRQFHQCLDLFNPDQHLHKITDILATAEVRVALCRMWVYVFVLLAWVKYGACEAFLCFCLCSLVLRDVLGCFLVLLIQA
jgi:hypothetical protein